MDILSDVFDPNGVASNILVIIGNTSLLSLVGSRLLFNMKEAGERGLNQGTSCSSRSTASSIDFAEAPGGNAAETSQIEEIELEEMRDIEEVPEIEGIYEVEAV